MTLSSNDETDEATNFPESLLKIKQLQKQNSYTIYFLPSHTDSTFFAGLVEVAYLVGTFGHGITGFELVISKMQKRRYQL